MAINHRTYRKHFFRANLSGADLSGADLTCADFTGANLSGANLSGADLSGSDFFGANLSGANLYGAKLIGAHLYIANLSGADLTGADLSETSLSNTIGLPDIYCPKEGSFIGYKKVRQHQWDFWVNEKPETIIYANIIAKLEIPEYAKRSSATTTKCRCNIAKVLDFLDSDGNSIPDLVDAISTWDPDYIYRKGCWVVVNDFDERRWHECAPGIHFFMTFDEALYYQF